MDTILNSSRLIHLVGARTALWDSSDHGHADRELVKHLWRQVIAEMGLDEADALAVCQKKWKNLRENFRKEYKKEKAGKCSKWQYYESLQFLRTQYGGVPLSSKESEAVFHLTAIDPFSLEDLDDGDSTVSVQSLSSYQSSSPPPTKKSKSSNRRESSDRIESCSRIESSNRIESSSGISSSQSSGMLVTSEGIVLPDGELQSSFNVNMDSEYHFLMSLLPSLRAVPEHRKLSVWTRLLNVLAEEQAASE